MINSPTIREPQKANYFELSEANAAFYIKLAVAFGLGLSFYIGYRVGKSKSK